MFRDVNQGVKRRTLHLGNLNYAGLEPGTYTSRNKTEELRAFSAEPERVARKQASYST